MTAPGGFPAAESEMSWVWEESDDCVTALDAVGILSCFCSASCCSGADSGAVLFGPSGDAEDDSIVARQLIFEIGFFCETQRSFLNTNNEPPSNEDTNLMK